MLPPDHGIPDQIYDLRVFSKFVYDLDAFDRIEGFRLPCWWVFG
jgi:hypothetical protein